MWFCHIYAHQQSSRRGRGKCLSMMNPMAFVGRKVYFQVSSSEMSVRSTRGNVVILVDSGGAWQRRWSRRHFKRSPMMSRRHVLTSGISDMTVARVQFFLRCAGCFCPAFRAEAAVLWWRLCRTWDVVFDVFKFWVSLIFVVELCAACLRGNVDRRAYQRGDLMYWSQGVLDVLDVDWRVGAVVDYLSVRLCHLASIVVVCFCTRCCNVYSHVWVNVGLKSIVMFLRVFLGFVRALSFPRSVYPCGLPTCEDNGLTFRGVRIFATGLVQVQSSCHLIGRKVDISAKCHTSPITHTKRFGADGQDSNVVSGIFVKISTKKGRR